MSKQYDDNQIERDFADVLGGLADIRRTIDAAGYPGVAWRPRRRWGRYVAAAGVAAAAAAIVLIAIVLQPARQTPSQLASVPEQVQLTEAAPPLFTLDIPTDFNPGEIGPVSLDAPAVSISSPDLQLDVPTFSLPTLTFNGL